MKLIIRAQPESAAVLTDIAIAAKRHWGYRDRWIECWRPLLTITPDFICANDVFMAIDHHDEPIGWYGLVGTSRRMTLDHLWVRPDQIGMGVGRALFRHALHRAAERHAEEIEWKADPHAAGFYKRMGAEQIGNVAATMDGTERRLPHYRIRVPAPTGTSSGQEQTI